MKVLSKLRNRWYIRLPLSERFFKYVKKSNGCWEWTGSKNWGGYGVIAPDHQPQKLILAHRASWIIHRGVIPVNLKVLHKCDKPQCVNPDHLWIGTQKENMRDMAKKSRQWKQQLFHKIKPL